MSEPAPVIAQPPTGNAVPVPPALAPRPVAAATLQQRAVRAAKDTRRTLARALPQVQYRLARLGPAGLGGIAALIAASIVALALWLPAHQSVAALSAELSSPGSTLGRGPSAQVPGDRLIAALPTRLQIPAVLSQVLAQASKAGVALDQGHYGYQPPKAGSLGRYSFEFPVTAPYPNVRDFINRTLTAIPAAGLDKLKIERKAIGDATIDADIGFVVFVRGS